MVTGPGCLRSEDVSLPRHLIGGRDDSMMCTIEGTVRLAGRGSIAKCRIMLPRLLCGGRFAYFWRRTKDQECTLLSKYNGTDGTGKLIRLRVERKLLLGFVFRDRMPLACSLLDQQMQVNDGLSMCAPLPHCSLAVGEVKSVD